MTQKKQLETFLFSTAGVAVMFLIVVAIYIISGAVRTRFDLTQEKLYTLSPGTKAILQKLDTPVEIRFYCTQDSREMPVQLKTYAERVEDLLNEYKKNSRGKIRIKKLDPKPDSDAEDSANLDGVEGVTPNLGSDKIYLGLAINQLDSKIALPFLSPDRERLLEYDISRAISRVVSPAKPVIGIMSALPLFGDVNPMMMRMNPMMQRQDPWVFVRELKRDFDVKQVEMTVDEIPSDIKVLVVVHPKAITDKAQYAIDQFVLRGGKLVAFLDPYSIVDSRNTPGMNPMQAAQIPGSNMEKLLKAWGLSFDANKVVADMNYVTRINRGNRAESAPAVLSLTQDAVDKNDVVTSEIDSALIPFAGVFTGTPADGLKETVLIKTSKESQLVDRFMVDMMGEQTQKDFVASGKEQALALRLTGKFKTAFPDGKPKDTAENKEDKKDEAKTEPAPTETPLKESKSDGVVILVGDSDLLYDQFAVSIQDFFGQQIIQPRNGNLNLVQNMVEQLAGDSNLIAVRSRATMTRPFTLVRKMQNQAEDHYRAKIKGLEASLQEAQTRLNELQKNKEAGQRFIVTPEQQEEIKKFQIKQAETKKELKDVRKNLRQDIDSLENRLKWVNIAGMPLLVTVSGISLALIKKKKTAAQ